jgi:hypothetical protein
MENHDINVQHAQYLCTCNVWSKLSDVFFSLFQGLEFNMFDKLAATELALGALGTFYLKQ